MGTTFEKVEKISVADLIMKQMINKIMSGDWKAGDKLPSEAELIEAFGASKYAIRTVLAKLNSMGIVETRQGAGSFICSVDSIDYLKPLLPVIFKDRHRFVSVAEFRLGIEPVAAELAAERATKEQLVNMKETVEQLLECQDGIEQYAQLDMSFHVQVAKASGNVIFIQAMNILEMLYMADVRAFTDRKEAGVHKEIYEAIASGDKNKA